ncbi:MAG: hypothetical protein Q9178_004259 [Gyalolechia marmorata]
MPSVQPSHTDGVGRQDSPGSNQELRRLRSRLASFASGSDEQPFTPEEASDAVRCLDRYVAETASDRNARSSLSTMAEGLEAYRFNAFIGDHAQVLCDLLKKEDEAPVLLQHSWTTILPEVEKEKRQLAAWIASSGAVPRAPRPCTSYTDALVWRVECLRDRGLMDVDTDIALFAVETYANRNSLFHGRTFDLFMSKRYAELASQLDLDDKKLESLLPDKERHLVDKYRSLITLHREIRICKDRSGNWVKRQAPPLEVSDQFLRPSKEALRARLDHGDLRPPGLKGPPPPSVSFSPTAFRRHTVSDREGGTKRPAEEQPPGQPLFKAARGLDYIVNSGIPKVVAKKTDMGDKDFEQLCKLCTKLHGMADALTREAPSDAKKIFERQIPELEQELKDARAATEKQVRKALKKRT